MRRIVLELVLLSLLAAVVAASGNLLRKERLPLRLPSAYYHVESGAQPVLLPQARRLFEAGEAAFIDARPGHEYESGQIQGAYSLPFEEWREAYALLAPWIENQPLVIYASESQISLADDLAGALIQKGHRDALYLFVGSPEDWERAGLPLRTGPDPIRSAPADGDSMEAW